MIKYLVDQCSCLTVEEALNKRLFSFVFLEAGWRAREKSRNGKVLCIISEAGKMSLSFPLCPHLLKEALAEHLKKTFA